MANRRRNAISKSVLLLLFLAAVLINLGIGWLAQETINGGWVEFRMGSRGSLFEVSLLPDSQKPLPKADEKAEQEEERKNRELVQNHRIAEEKAPEKTNRVSEFDNRVQHETKAPNRRPSPLQKPIQGQQAKQGSDKNSAQQPSRSLLDSRIAGQLEESKSRRSDASQVRDATSELNLQSDKSGRIANQTGPSQASRANLAGSPRQLRNLFGGPGTFDALRDVDESSENLLNTRRYKYASFFNRIRNAIAQHWHPEVVHAARDPYGKIYGTKSRVTRLMIRLRPDGSLVRIALDRQSGVDYLDEEAIRAVRTAAPFANPPPQLVDDETGFIDFGFMFTLEISGKRSIFRFQQ